MSDYVKQLEEQNEDLKRKLADAELVKYVMKFAELALENPEEFTWTDEALEDLRNMFSIDMEEVMCDAAMKVFLEKLGERFPSMKQAIKARLEEI